MTADNNNIRCQNWVRSYLQGLKLPLILQEEKWDVTDGLESIENLIANYALQGSIFYRSIEAAIKNLYNSVICSEGTKPALTQCYTNCPLWTLQKLYTALVSTWKQEQRHSKSKPKIVVQIPYIFWKVQRMYGAPKRKTTSTPYRRTHQQFN